MRVHRYLHQYRFDSPLKSWIGQVAYSVAKRHLERKRIPLVDAVDDLDGLSPLDNIGDGSDLQAAHAGREDERELHAAIEALPPVQRALLTLYHTGRTADRRDRGHPGSPKAPSRATCSVAATNCAGARTAHRSRRMNIPPPYDIDEHSGRRRNAPALRTRRRHRADADDLRIAHALRHAPRRSAAGFCRTLAKPSPGRSTAPRAGHRPRCWNSACYADLRWCSGCPRRHRGVLRHAWVATLATTCPAAPMRWAGVPRPPHA